LLFLCLSVASAVFFSAQQAEASILFSDNFNTYTNGPLDGQGGWESNFNNVSVDDGVLKNENYAGARAIWYNAFATTTGDMTIYFDAYVSTTTGNNGSSRILVEDVLANPMSGGVLEDYLTDGPNDINVLQEGWQSIAIERSSNYCKVYANGTSTAGYACSNYGFNTVEIILNMDLAETNIAYMDNIIIATGSYNPDYASYSSSTLNTYSTGFNSTYDTRFTDIAITDLEPQGPPPPAHGHVQIDVDYWLEESEIDVNNSMWNPTQVKFSYALRPSTSTNSSFTTISATSYGSGSTTIDFPDLVDGTYDLLVQFSNIGASLGLSPQPFAEAYIYTSFTLLDQNLSATGTPEYYDNTTPPDQNRYLDCSLTQIDNCLKNVGIFLFYPSPDSLDNFYTLQESIDQKFPFNYISDFKDAFIGFYTTATTQSMTLTVPFGTFGDITLISADLINDVPLSSTIRTILGYLLWVMLVYQIYRRTLRIFNSQETTA